MATPTIYLVDDQDAVRHALGEMLATFGYRVETYDSAESLLSTLADPRPGCIVADVRMPGMDGIELVRALSRRRITLPVVLISGHADVPMAVAAMKAGAEDFIEKPVDDTQLMAAINRAYARLFDQLSRELSLEEERRRFERLTPREMEVMDLVVEGLTSQAIAARLGISPRTAESYRAQVMDKMQAQSVPGLVRTAIRLGRSNP